MITDRACENCKHWRINTSFGTGMGLCCGVDAVAANQCCQYYESQQERPRDSAIDHPSHYTQGGIECIDALKAATINLTGIHAVCTANAIKYLWRWHDKGGAEDLRKAKWYIDRLISEVDSK